MLDVTFCAQVPKDLNCPETVEDSLFIACDRCSIVISDGASESFDSKRWADSIVSQYINQNLIDRDWLLKLIENYEKKLDVSNLSWSKQASYDRGSFATLLGIHLDIKKKILSVDGIGDCLAVLLLKSEAIITFPYKFSRDFDQNPLLLSTKIQLNDQLFNTEILDPINFTIDSDTVQTVILMSDALANWCLKRIELNSLEWKKLLTFKSQSDLDNFVLNERQNKTMAVDDVTLMIANVQG